MAKANRQWGRFVTVAALGGVLLIPAGEVSAEEALVAEDLATVEQVEVSEAEFGIDDLVIEEDQIVDELVLDETKDAELEDEVAVEVDEEVVEDAELLDEEQIEAVEDLEEFELEDPTEKSSDARKVADQVVHTIETIDKNVKDLTEMGKRWEDDEFHDEDIDAFNDSIQSIVGLIPESQETMFNPVMNHLANIAKDINKSVQIGLTGWMNPGNYYQLDTWGVRAEMFELIGQSIQRATTELNNKVNEAHVEIGFEVTRTLINALDPFSRSDALEAQLGRLHALMDRADQFAELTPDSRATIYTKSALDHEIWQMRFHRDKELLGKVASKDYFAYNRQITKAVGVQLNPRSTVQDIHNAVAELKALKLQSDGWARK